MARGLFEVSVPPEVGQGEAWNFLRRVLRSQAGMDHLEERYGIIVFLSSTQQPDRRSLRCNVDPK